ncbi:hypothetical protein [Cellulomonas marina]|uniref:Endoglucanase n=1 Tax=Cellulomonas marina TaxID=988821 RepID=A0A1I0Y5W6_9CELL|nr:hypothetical protein [Cellulomonas marina]GIG29760.1 hypothetical protein Cma02nite_23600 [Cellulomonas marina]SFB07543.1 endoglucanase [Cellulomonas marina]
MSRRTTALILSTALAGAALAATAPAAVAAPAIASELHVGETLRVGENLSVEGELADSHLEMQTDGNVVLYVNDGSGDVALWQSGTAGHPGAYLVMQTDGNAVVYAGDNGPALWQSGTYGNPNAYLVLQGDANAVIYGNGGAKWQSGTYISTDLPNVLFTGEVLASGEELVSPSGTVTLAMQRDGNLVAYANGRAFWSAGIKTRPGAYAVLQSDNNFVVYTADGTRALWQSRTSAPGVDGAVVVYDDGVTVETVDEYLWVIEP